MNKPLASFVCVTYNRPEMLKELLYCFLAQDYENKELIIINDQPNIKYFYDDPRVKIYNLDERFPSVGAKRNFSKSKISGDYIFITNDDDLYYHNHISRLIEYHQQHPEHDIVGNKIAYFSIDNQNVSTFTHTFPANGGCIKADYFLNNEFPNNRSAGEDVEFIKNANIGLIDDGKTTFHYRWGLSLYHMNGLGDDGMNSYKYIGANSIKDYREITLEPQLSHSASLNYNGKTIGIAILATNAYFVLGIKLIKRFSHFYVGDNKIKFYFFSDIDPKDYLPDNVDVKYYNRTNDSWLEGTNSNFLNILTVRDELDCDYLYYMDADTDVNAEFNEDWFLGEMVGVEHFFNRSQFSDLKPYDRNPESKAYVPLETELEQTYFHGAFFGGKTDKFLEVLEVLHNCQVIDQKIPYEPRINDESYINKYFHYNPPTNVIKYEDFKFIPSDKSGIGNPREMGLNIEEIKGDLKKHKNDVIDIVNNKVVEIWNQVNVISEQIRKPLASCVCVTFNRPELLNELLYCFLNQDYENKELIILNDQADVKYIYKDPNVRIYNLDERFPSLGAKRNYTRNLINGDYVFIMDDDDIYYSSHISTLLGHHEKNPKYDIVINKKAHYTNLVDGDYTEWNINVAFNGASITKEYYQNNEFPNNRSAGEDLEFIDYAKINFLDEKNITFHYRMTPNVNHISRLYGDGESIYKEITENTPIGKTKTIQLIPQLSERTKKYYR